MDIGERRLSVESLYPTCSNPTPEPNNSIQKAQKSHLTGRTPSPLPILRKNSRRSSEGKLVESDNRWDGGCTGRSTRPDQYQGKSPMSSLIRKPHAMTTPSFKIINYSGATDASKDESWSHFENSAQDDISRIENTKVIIKNPTSEVNISGTDTRSTEYNDIAVNSGNNLHQPCSSSNYKKCHAIPYNDTKAGTNEMRVPEKQDYRSIKNSSSSQEDAHHSCGSNSVALNNLRAGFTRYVPITGKILSNVGDANWRGSTPEKLMLIEMDSVHAMNKHLCTTLQMTEIRHVEEKEVLLHQLSILQADSEELGVENSALATVLLGGIKETFSSICNTSSSNLNSNSNLNLNAKSAFPKPFPQSTSLSTTLSSSSLPTIYSTPPPVSSSSATFSMSYPPTESIANGESWEVSRSLCGDFHKIADRTHDHQKCDSARRPLTSTSTTATAPAEYNNMESVGLSSGPCIFSPRQPCRSRKITAATESLLELSGLMEEVVMKAKPQHELQMRFYADTESLRRELEECHIALLNQQQKISQLENVRVQCVSTAETAAHTAASLLAEKDQYLRLATTEILALRSDRSDYVQKIEMSVTELAQAKQQVQELEGDVAAKNLLLSDLRKKEISRQEECNTLQHIMRQREVQLKAEQESTLHRIACLESALEKAKEDRDAHVRSAEDVHSIEVKALTLEIEDLKRTVEQYNLKVDQYRVKDAQSLAALQSMQQEKQRLVDAQVTLTEKTDHLTSQLESMSATHAEELSAAVDRSKKEVQDVIEMHRLREESSNIKDGEAAALRNNQFELTIDTAAKQADLAYRTLAEEHVQDIQRLTAKLLAERVKSESARDDQVAESERLREHSHQCDKQSFLSSIGTLELSLELQRVAHTEQISSRDRAIELERDITRQQRLDDAASSDMMITALRGQIAALHDSIGGEREALGSVLTSLRLAADKEKEMMELLLVAENSHCLERDAMQLRLTAAESQASMAVEEAGKANTDLDKITIERNRLVLEAKEYKSGEETLLSMLADCKDTHNVDKESALSEREEFLIKLDYAAAKEEEMESKIQGLKAEQALVVEERVVWGKERAGLLTRIVLLSEQRSDLMLKNEEAEKRSEFQETTIAGLNEEWASLQSELIAAESDRAVLKTELLTAAQNKIKSDESFTKQICALQADLDGYIGESDTMQSEHSEILLRLEGEMEQLEKEYRSKEASMTSQIKVLRDEREKGRERESMKRDIRRDKEQEMGRMKEKDDAREIEQRKERGREKEAERVRAMSEGGNKEKKEESVRKKEFEKGKERERDKEKRQPRGDKRDRLHISGVVTVTVVVDENLTGSQRDSSDNTMPYPPLKLLSLTPPSAPLTSKTVTPHKTPIVRSVHVADDSPRDVVCDCDTCSMTDLPRMESSLFKSHRTDVDVDTLPGYVPQSPLSCDSYLSMSRDLQESCLKAYTYIETPVTPSVRTLESTMREIENLQCDFRQGLIMSASKSRK